MALKFFIKVVVVITVCKMNVIESEKHHGHPFKHSHSSCPKTANWKQPKMYVSYFYINTIETIDLVDGKYVQHDGDAIKIEKKFLYFFNSNKAGTKIYATINEDIVVYTRTSCSHKFVITHNETTKESVNNFVLDPSEKYLIAKLDTKEKILSYRLLGNGSMTKAYEYSPHEGDTGDFRSMMIAYDPKFDIVAVPYIAENEIAFYKFERNTGKLSYAKTDKVKLSDGYRPWALVFSPNGRFVYVIDDEKYKIIIIENKLGNYNFDDVILSKKDGDTGEFGERGAGIRMHPEGKYLYALHYGFNSIGIFEVVQNGQLKLIDFQNVGGLDAMNFLITPKGDQLIIFYGQPNKMVIYSIGRKGKLTKKDEVKNLNGIAEFIAYPSDMHQ